MNEYAQKIAKYMFSNFVDKIFKGIGAALAAFPGYLSRFSPDFDKLMRDQITPAAPSLQKLWQGFVGFIIDMLFWSSVAGLFAALILIFCLILRQKDPFTPCSANRIRGWSSGFFYCFVAAVVAAYILMLKVRSGMWDNVFAGLVSPMGQDWNRVVVIMILGALMSCFLGAVTFSGMLYALAPAELRVLAAPWGVRHVFRSILRVT